jgi:hypothetical protein
MNTRVGFHASSAPASRKVCRRLLRLLYNENYVAACDHARLWLDTLHDLRLCDGLKRTMHWIGISDTTSAGTFSDWSAQRDGSSAVGLSHTSRDLYRMHGVLLGESYT